MLVPLFRVDLEPSPDAREIDVSSGLTPRNVHATIITEVYFAAGNQRLMDPCRPVGMSKFICRIDAVHPGFGAGGVICRLVGAAGGLREGIADEDGGAWCRCTRGVDRGSQRGRVYGGRGAGGSGQQDSIRSGERARDSYGGSVGAGEAGCP